MSLHRLSGLVLSACLCAATATAGTFSFTGVFTQDDQLQVFLFTASSTDAMISTLGYGGGTNFAGATIHPGGFDPILSVFDAGGGLGPSSLLIGANNDGPDCSTNPAPCVTVDASTGLALDSLVLLSGLNVGGSYAIVLSQSDNAAIGPTYGDGFQEAGNGNFTSSMFPCGQAAFCDAGLNPRNGNWAVDISGASSASVNGTVPEPGTVLFLTSGLAGLWLMRRNKGTKQV